MENDKTFFDGPVNENRTYKRAYTIAKLLYYMYSFTINVYGVPHRAYTLMGG